MEEELTPGAELGEVAANAVEAPEAEAEAPELEFEAPPAKPEKGPSRVGAFSRRALRWAVLVLAIFVLGIGALWFRRVQPMEAEISELRSSLEASQAEAATLQAEVDRLQGVDEENQRLATEFELAQGRLALLSVLVDVTTAQLAVAQEEPIKAKAALEDTTLRLADLQRRVPEEEVDRVRSARERLALVLDEVETDIFAAQRDLEILANQLLEMDRDLFEP